MEIILYMRIYKEVNKNVEEYSVHEQKIRRVINYDRQRNISRTKKEL